jgi:hypothetical protein
MYYISPHIYIHRRFVHCTYVSTSYICMYNNKVFLHTYPFQWNYICTEHSFSKCFFPAYINEFCFFGNQKTVTYYELIKQKVLQTNPKVISSKYDSCKFPAFSNASKVQHASLGAGSWCRLLVEVKECAAQKGNFFDCTDDSFML